MKQNNAALRLPYVLVPQMFLETARHYGKTIRDCQFACFGVTITCTNKLLVGRACDSCDEMVVQNTTQRTGTTEE